MVSNWKVLRRFIMHILLIIIYEIIEEDSIIANITIDEGVITRAEIEPVRIRGFGNTIFPTSEKKEFILNEIYEFSKMFWKIETIKEGYIEVVDE